MKKLTRQFVFQQVYNMASIVEVSIEDEETLIELDWQDPKVINEITSFSKISILHRYIYAMVAIRHRYDYRKNSDLYEEEEINKIEDLLTAYKVKYLTYKDFVLATFPNNIEEDLDIFYYWFLSQETSFESLWEKLTEEVFHLLFGNRAFLLRFNKAIARYLFDRKHLIPKEYLDENGTIKRHSLYSWVKKAVYFRDQGRCVLCQKDLSGLLSTDRINNFDHMVPLAQWGINDPCNIQLLCQECNLKKGKRKSITGIRYTPWWQD